MPTVSTMPAMPGSDSDACSIDSSAVEQHHVRQQHGIGDHAERAVVHHHPDERREHADHERAHAALDVVLAEAGADGALLDDVERRGQRSGAQQQRELAGFVRPSRPVIWKLLPNTPRIVATLMTSSSVHSVPARVRRCTAGRP